MGTCLWLSGTSATAPVKADFFTIILFYSISQFISLHVMTNDDIEWSDIFEKFYYENQKSEKDDLLH